MSVEWDASSMVLIRKVAAIIALAALGGLIVTLERGSYGVNPGLVVVTQALLVPLVFTMVGLLFEQVWSRWLGLAGAVAVLPWAVVLTFGLNLQRQMGRMIPGGAPLRRADDRAESLQSSCS